jgi:hypothetical protein
VAWAPDGKRIAYLWLDVKPLPNAPDAFMPNASRLVVCAPDRTKATSWPVHDFTADPGYTRLVGWFPAKPPAARRVGPR